jgi:hypothetical protein
LQEQEVCASLAESDSELQGQSLHSSDDSWTSLNMFALHAWTPAPRPVYPAAARQSSDEFDPLEDTLV